MDTNRACGLSNPPGAPNSKASTFTASLSTTKRKYLSYRIELVPSLHSLYLLTNAIAWSGLGVNMVLPVGGADMPVVVSLLNFKGRI